MRAGGARVGVGELLAAHRALAAVDPSSREDAYFALRAALCSTRAELALFAEAFASVFADRGARGPAGRAGRDRARRDAARRHPADRRRGRVSQTSRATPSPPPTATRSCCARRTSRPTPTPSGRSRAGCWRGSPRRSPQRLSRRTRPTRRRRDVHDLRATVRASLRHGGELMERRYREPGLKAAPDRARLRRLGLDGAVRADAAAVPAGLGRRPRAGRGVRVRHAAHARDARAAAAAIPIARWRAPPSASPTGRAARGSARRWPSSTASTAAGSAAARSS